MKYQDLETRSQYSKIQSLLSRLYSVKSTSEVRMIKLTSRSTLQSQQSVRALKFQPERLQPLAVEVLQHQDHNILFFMPAESEPVKKQKEESQRLRIYRHSKAIMSRASQKRSHFTASTKNSFRMKKWNGKDDESHKQNRSGFESREQLFRPLLMQSKVIKEEQFLEQKQFRIGKKAKSVKEQHPELLKYLVNHKCLAEFEAKCRMSQQKLITLQTGKQFVLLKDLLKENPIFHKPQIKEKVRCCEGHIAFLLNSIYLLQPNLIKRLFGRYGNETKIALNYQGCFRSIPINYFEDDQQNNFIKTESGSLWPRILDQALTTLVKNKSKSSLKTKEFFEMITGLVMHEIKINETSEEKLLEIVSSLEESQMIMGEIHNGEFSTITCKQNSQYVVKKYIYQQICSQFQPKASTLVDHLMKHYKVIRVANLYPNYYFIYKKIDYTLGTDFCMKFDVEQAITLTLQISKQTIAFDAKIRLSLEQKRQEGVEELYGEYVKSAVSLKKVLKLLPGSYVIRFSDDKESIKEYKFSMMLGLICKKNIAGWVKGVNNFD